MYVKCPAHYLINGIDCLNLKDNYYTQVPTHLAYCFSGNQKATGELTSHLTAFLHNTSYHKCVRITRSIIVLNFLSCSILYESKGIMECYKVWRHCSYDEIKKCSIPNYLHSNKENYPCLAGVPSFLTEMNERFVRLILVLRK